MHGQLGGLGWGPGPGPEPGARPGRRATARGPGPRARHGQAGGPNFEEDLEEVLNEAGVEPWDGGAGGEQDVDDDPEAQVGEQDADDDPEAQVGEQEWDDGPEAAGVEMETPTPKRRRLENLAGVSSVRWLEDSLGNYVLYASSWVGVSVGGWLGG